MMEGYMLNKWRELTGLLLLVSIIYPSTLLGKSVADPNNLYTVIWTDTPDGKEREIEVTNKSGEMLWKYVTHPRWTLVAWNSSGTMLAIANGPDNANSELFIFNFNDQKLIKTHTVNWDQVETYIETKVDQTSFFRTQIVSIKWISKKDLQCVYGTPSGGYNLIFSLNGDDIHYSLVSVSP
jgi:hypothetical protein